MDRTAAWSITPAWVLALAGVLAVAFSPLREQWTLWLPVACGIGVIVALALQVATRAPEGFITRSGVALLGVVVVFAVGSVVLSVVGVG